MKILVSSQDNIFLVDIETEEITPFVQNPPALETSLLDYIRTDQKEDVDRYGFAKDYYGITWVRDRIFATYGEFPSVLLELNSKGEVLKVQVPPRQHPQIIRAHQITAANDDIIITSTHNDLLFKFNALKETWSIYHIGGSGFIPIAKKDLFHPNSIRFVNNQLHLIIFTGLKTSTLVKYEYPSMKVIEKIEIDALAHCSWDMDGSSWHCASASNCIKGSDGRQIDLDGWTRGVALLNGILIVGAGQFGKREDRKKLNSTIFVFKDMVKWKEIPFKGSIRDIRLVNVFDEVHNQPIFHVGIS